MPLYLIFIFFVAITVFVAAFGYEKYARPGRVYERIGEGAAEKLGTGVIQGEVRKGPEFKFLQKLGEMVPLAADTSGVTRRLLVQAGYRSENASKILAGMKVFGGIAGGMFGIVMRNSSANPAAHIMIPLGGLLFGYMAPALGLEKKAKKRKETLRLSLPDALDLMVIAVEAGLGLDQAIKYVATELRGSHPALSEELSLVNLEIRAGSRRTDALQNLATRTSEPEIRKLTAILIQNDRFGTGVAESLRSHSDYMRVRRRQEAEERAAKVGVKLVFPIFFFILPAMMMVCAGPAVLAVVKYLLPLMKGFGK